MTTPLPIAQFIGPRPEPGLRPTNSVPDRAGGFADRLDAARARLAETAQRSDPTKIDRRSPEPRSVTTSERPATSIAHDARSTESGPSDQAEARDRSATETNADSTAPNGKRSSLEDDVAGDDSVDLRSNPAADGDAADSNAAENDGADATGAELESVGTAAEGVDEAPAAITTTVEGSEAGRSIEPEDATVGAVVANTAMDVAGADTAADDAAADDTAAGDTAAGDTAADDAASAAVSTERPAAGNAAGKAENAAAEGTSAQNSAEESPVSESTVASDTAVDDAADRDDDGAAEIRPEQAVTQAAALATVATPQRPTASSSSEVTAAEAGPDDAVVESSTAAGTADGEVAMSAEASQAAVIRPGEGTDGLGAETGDGDQSSRATSDPTLSPRPVTSSGSAAADTMSMPPPPVGPAAESSSSPLVTSTAPTLLGDDVEAQLWDQVQQALGRVRASEDGQELRMRLRPADLGELLIQVHTRGEHVSVRLATTNDGARQALLDDQARLAEELANAGFQGASVDVRQENDGGDRSERDDAGPVRFDRADTVPPTRRGEAILRHHRRSSIELTL